MIRLKPALTREEVKRTPVGNLRQEYNTIALSYNRVYEREVLYCHKCDDFHGFPNFYTDKKYASGVFPICKKCVMEMACDFDKKEKTYTDNFDKTIRVLEMMDLPYIDTLYKSLEKNNQEAAPGERYKRSTVFSAYITTIKSLPNWRNKTWKDSEFPSDYSTEEDQINENSRILKQAKKRFGEDYTPQELMFLESEYQDWIKRYACENKAQEILFKRICFKELEIDKAQKNGKDTKELDKTLQDLMASLSVKPSQANSNALTEAKTFGQLIQKWEEEQPIPEPDEDFKSVNNIGLYIDVFFKGHMARMMNLKNAFSNTYEKFIKKYVVDKPQYDEDTDSDALFDQIFGTEADI